MTNYIPGSGYRHIISSPVGKLYIIASDKGLQALLWEQDMQTKDSQMRFNTLIRAPEHQVIRKTTEQLEQYFKGGRRTFSIPLDFQGTAFQKQAWQALVKIPYGETRSYQAQAKMLGDKRKARAVGAANGRNPISIIVPCHRVIAADGSLRGFRGGLKQKGFLLELEQC